MSGPLDGVRVIELAGIGPSPFACMMLADAGADVLRLERAPAGASAALTGTGEPGAGEAGTGESAAAGDGARSYWDVLNRNRPSVGIDLKQPQAVGLVLNLVERADVLIEGFRPGVAERIGVGPQECAARNPKLVYGRMTGWGQDGPLAPTAGHDIDYIAISGALWSLGRHGERPVAPLNLVGDFGGGGMLLAFGVLAALVEARRSGVGQVVDAAMTDGSAALMAMIYGFKRLGWWKEERGMNILDSGAHFYEVYETADGRYFAVGAMEAKFYAELLRGLGLDQEDLPDQMDRERWPEMKERFAAVFRSKTRDEWAAIFDGTDACAVPVLSPWEAHEHPHNKARETFTEVDGLLQPAPAPRFSRTPTGIRRPPSHPGADTDQGLTAWGIEEPEIARLRQSGAIS